jgi:hypothetical protein
MRRLVADAGVIAGWFGDGARARALRAEYESGMLSIAGPVHLPHDLVGLFAERIGPDARALERIATEIDRLGFELHDPPVGGVARWVARGLDPRRAAYVAVAEALDLTLVTDDESLRRAAGPRAKGMPDA